MMLVIICLDLINCGNILVILIVFIVSSKVENMAKLRCILRVICVQIVVIEKLFPPQKLITYVLHY